MFIKNLFVLIIVAIAIKVFLLIPSPLEMLQGTFIVGIILLPLSFALYISLVGFLIIVSLNLIKLIFRNTINDKSNTFHKKKSNLIVNTLKIGALITLVSFTLGVTVLVIFVNAINTSNKNRVLKTYHMHYQTEEYNDSRINSYNIALKKASKDLIEAESMYEIFKADAKRKISLKCIEVFRKEHNATLPYQADSQIKGFKLNARNYYANNDKMIKKSIKVEKLLDTYQSAFCYPKSSGYGLLYQKVQLEQSCKNELSVNKIFENFIPFYLEGQENKFYLSDIPSSNKYVRLQKKWLGILHEKYPKWAN